MLAKLLVVYTYNILKKGEKCHRKKHLEKNKKVVIDTV